MTIKIKHKRGTASNITSANPTLAAGELAFETDTRRFKVGDGTTAWSSLSYVTPYVTATDRILGRSSAGAGSAEEITCTAFGRSLIDDADAAAARGTLSVQPTASPAFTGTVSAAAANFTGAVSVTSPLTLTGTVAGNVRQLKFQTSGSDRWYITPSFGAESGSNAGSDFQILRFNDSAGFLGTPLLITRSTGVVTCENGMTLGGQLLVTAGSASACGVAFSGDGNTGVFSPSADVFCISTAGSERFRVASNGDAQVGGVNVVGLRYFDVRNTDSTLNSGAIIRLITRNAANTSDTSVDLLRYNSGLFAITNNDSGPVAINTGGSERVRVENDGVVKMIDVYGDTVGATNRDLFIDDTGKLGYVSSIRASKTGITAIDDVSWLRDLTPVSFHYRRRNADGTYSDEPDGTLDYGLIAEEVEPVAPELCFYDFVDGEPQLRGVHYSKLITPMLRYIQQLEQRIAALEERINA